MSLTHSEQIAFKPFSYPWAYEAWLTQQRLHWLPEEVPLADDVKDWRTKLTVAERNLLTQIFRFFTQADVEVNNCYMRHYSRVFKPTEVCMMLAAFSAMETVHIAAYSHLLDTIGMPETEYSAFLQYKEMKDKYDYMQDFNVDSPSDIAMTLAVFGAFTEGLQLFASFAMLMNFSRFNKMKGMGQIVTWSVRDETLHTQSIIKLFHTFLAENPGVRTPQFEQQLETACRTIVEHEDAFIDLAFELGGIEGMTAKDVKRYIRHIADRRLKQLGLKPIYFIEKNPLPWMDSILNGIEHTNFFENRSTEYSKASTTGSWDEALSRLDVVAAFGGGRRFRVYSKDGCPSCVKAKALLTEKGYDYELVDLSDNDTRMAFYADRGFVKGIDAFMPKVYDITEGHEELIGGFEVLEAHLGKALD